MFHNADIFIAFRYLTLFSLRQLGYAQLKKYRCDHIGCHLQFLVYGKNKITKVRVQHPAIRFGFDSTAGLNFDLGFSLQLTEILSESN